MYIEEKFSTDYRCPFKVMGEDCRGCECAAWRWKPELNPAWQPKHDMLMTGARDYRIDPPPYIDSKTHGYCGLATRPNIQG